MQATDLDWPGRLPHGLTQLVLSSLGPLTTAPEAPQRAVDYDHLCRLHLPLLQELRHLAFHNLLEVGHYSARKVCTAAGTLPHLVSLHLVRYTGFGWHVSIFALGA